MLTKAPYLILLGSLVSCQGTSLRNAGASTGSGGSGGSVHTSTDTGTDTATSTDTSTDTDTNILTFTNTDTSTSPPPPLIINGISITADQPSDCPNDLCLLTEDPTVQSHRQAATPDPTNSADIGTDARSIRNYFRMVCLATYVIDQWKPIYWENCTNTNIEKFFLEAINATQFYIHPAAQHNLCIEAPGTPLATGTQLFLNICNASQSQLFTREISGLVSFYHPALDATLCLVRGGDAFGNLTLGLWTCSPFNTNLMFQTL